MARCCEISLLTIVVAGALGASAGCGTAQKPEPARTESAPPAPAAAPDPEPAAPSDIASATRDNPLRPAAHVGQSIRDDAGPPMPGPPKLDALKLPPGFA